MNAIQQTSLVEPTPRSNSNHNGRFNAFVERAIVALLFVAVTTAACVRFDIHGLGKDFEAFLTLRKLHEIAPTVPQNQLLWMAAADNAEIEEPPVAAHAQVIVCGTQSEDPTGGTTERNGY